MKLNWELKKVKDFAEVVGGGTPSTEKSDYWGEGISWISPRDLSNYPSKYIKKGNRSITRLGIENSSAKLLPSNSLLFSSRAPIGYLAINTVPVTTNQGFKSLIPKKGFYTEYLYYLFKNNIKYLESYSAGTTFKEISGSVIKEIEFLIPGYNEQIKISNVLSILDEKIELNRNMNKTLQELAKMLFKSWFVDFDPVKSKKAGESVGLSKDISDLFKDSFKDSIFGKIPQSWKISKFGELLIPKRGKIITKKTIIPGEIPVVAGGINAAYYHSKSNATSPVVTISASGNAGYVNLFYNDIWASDCSYINKNVTDFVYFSHSFLKVNQNKIFHLRHGAVQQHINPKDLMGLDIVLPPISLISKYEQIVTPLHNKISNNLNEINTLSNLRDLLLPKLISGELKITDSQKLIDEVGV